MVERIIKTHELKKDFSNLTNIYIMVKQKWNKQGK